MANTSAGASQRQFEKTLDSLEAKLNKLTNAWDSFAMGVANASIIKTGVDAITGLLQVLNQVSNVLGKDIGGFLKLAMAIAAFKGANKIITGFFAAMKAEGHGDILTSLAISFKVLGKNISETFTMGHKLTQMFKKIEVPYIWDMGAQEAVRGREYVEGFENVAKAMGKTGEEAKNYAKAMSFGIQPAVLMRVTNEDLKAAFDAAAASNGMLTESEALENIMAEKSIAIKIAQTQANTRLGRAILKVTGWQATQIAGQIAMFALLAIKIVAVYVAIRAVAKAMYNASPEGQLKAAQHAAQELQKAAQNAAEAYDDLGGSLSDLAEKQQNLDNLVKGTNEWNDALLDVNQTVVELLNKFPELAQYVSATGGRLEISEEGVAAAKQIYSDRKIESAVASVAAENYVREKELDIKRNKLIADQTVSEGLLMISKGMVDQIAKQIALGMDENGKIFTDSAVIKDYLESQIGFTHVTDGTIDAFREFGNELRTFELGEKKGSYGVYKAQAYNKIAGAISPQYRATVDEMGDLFIESFMGKQKNVAAQAGAEEYQRRMKMYAQAMGYDKEDNFHISGNKIIYTDKEGKSQKETVTNEMLEQVTDPLVAIEQTASAMKNIPKDLERVAKTVGTVSENTGEEIAKGLLLGFENVTVNGIDDIEAVAEAAWNSLSTEVRANYENQQAFVDKAVASYINANEKRTEYLKGLEWNEGDWGVEKIATTNLEGLQTHLQQITRERGVDIANAIKQALFTGLRATDTIEDMETFNSFLKQLNATENWTNLQKLNALPDILKELNIASDNVDFSNIINQIAKLTNASYELDKETADERILHLQGIKEKIQKEPQKSFSKNEYEKLIQDGFDASTFKEISADNYVYLGSIEDLLAAINAALSVIVQTQISSAQNDLAKVERWQNFKIEGTIEKSIIEWASGEEVVKKERGLGNVTEKYAKEELSKLGLADEFEGLTGDEFKNAILEGVQKYTGEAGVALWTQAQKTIGETPLYNGPPELAVPGMTGPISWQPSKKFEFKGEGQGFIDQLKEGQALVGEGTVMTPDQVKEWATQLVAAAEASGVMADDLHTYKQEMAEAGTDTQKQVQAITKLHNQFVKIKNLTQTINRWKGFREAVKDSENIGQDFVDTFVPKNASNKLKNKLVKLFSDPKVLGAMDQLAAGIISDSSLDDLRTKMLSAFNDMDADIKFGITTTVDDGDLLSFNGTIEQLSEDAQATIKVLEALGLFEVETIEMPYEFQYGIGGSEVVKGVNTITVLKPTSANDIGSANPPPAGGGGGGGSSKEWKNPYDWLYNLTEDINEKLRERNILEKKYNLLVAQRKNINDEEIKYSKVVLDNLKHQQDLQQEMLDKRQDEMHRYLEENKEALSQYGTFNFEDMTIEIDWDLIDSIKDADEGSKIEEYIKKIEFIADEMKKAEETLLDIEIEVEEIRKRNEQAYIDLENRILDALVEIEQQRIDAQERIYDAINDAADRLLNALQTQIDEYREARDNEKTEEEIARKERRLAYLRQDTSGAHDLEILNLEKELSEAKENYQDQLVDQALENLQQQNEAAAEQRTKEIELMQAQLDWSVKTGLIAEQAHQIMVEAMESRGTLNTDSELYRVLYEGEGWQGEAFSTLMLKFDELRQAVAQAADYVVQNLQSAFADIAMNPEAYPDTDYMDVIKGVTEEYENEKIGYDQAVDLITRFEKARDDKINTFVDEWGMTYGEHYGVEATNGSLLKQFVDTFGANPVQVEDLQHTPRPGEPIPEVTGHIDYDIPGTGVTQPTTAAPVTDSWQGVKAVSISDPNFEVMCYETWNGYSPGGDYVYYDRIKNGSTDGKLDGQIPKSALKRVYKTGGLVNETGPAWLDGTRSNPEIVLNARDSANFIQLRDVLRDALQNAAATTKSADIQNVFDIDVNDPIFKDDYNVDDLISRIENDIYEKASYRNVYGASRLR